MINEKDDKMLSELRLDFKFRMMEYHQTILHRKPGSGIIEAERYRRQDNVINHCRCRKAVQGIKSNYP